MSRRDSHGILLYRSFFGVGDGVGLGGAGVDGAVTISLSFAPAASTSFVVISSLFKGATATTLQTRGISALRCQGRVQPNILRYCGDHQADSWFFLFRQRPELKAKPSHCVLRFHQAGLSHPVGNIERTSHSDRTLAVPVGAERSSVGITMSSAFSSESLIWNPKDASCPRTSSATVSASAASLMNESATTMTERLLACPGSTTSAVTFTRGVVAQLRNIREIPRARTSGHLCSRRSSAPYQAAKRCGAERTQNKRRPQT